MPYLMNKLKKYSSEVLTVHECSFQYIPCYEGGREYVVLTTHCKSVEYPGYIVLLASESTAVSNCFRSYSAQSIFIIAHSHMFYCVVCPLLYLFDGVPTTVPLAQY